MNYHTIDLPTGFERFENVSIERWHYRPLNLTYHKNTKKWISADSQIEFDSYQLLDLIVKIIHSDLRKYGIYFTKSNNHEGVTFKNDAVFGRHIIACVLDADGDYIYPAYSYKPGCLLRT